MSSHFNNYTAAAIATALVLVAGAGAADAKSCQKKYSQSCDSYTAYTEGQRQRASEREWERTRAKAYDPGGSYSGYPDWARYALSPKGGR